MSDAIRLVAGPFNRVEGDLEVRLDVEDGRVVRAFANSPLYRGFEVMLQGKDPRDALTITPRICGICSISQSHAAARALGAAQGIVPTEQGAIAACLIHAVENLADHLTHFCLFFMPDFAKPVYQVEPWHDRMLERFTAAKGSAVRSAIEARAQLLHIMGILAGKWPHTLAIQPGGVTKAPDSRDRVRMLAIVGQFRAYLERELYGAPLETFSDLKDPAELDGWATGDVALFLQASAAMGLDGLGRGPGRYMSYGAYEQAAGDLFGRGLWRDGAVYAIAFDRIREDASHAWLLGDERHPFEGLTEPDTEMVEPGYSWCKAPRLNGQSIEVGAFARQVVDGHPLAVALAPNGGSVQARVLGRLLEIARTVPALESWIKALQPGADFIRRTTIPDDAQGVGLTEAARGSLGHWLRIEGGRIRNYQIIAPTTWNFSPRDSLGQPGPLEAALVGAPVSEGETTPIAVQHIVRSFDPCMVCTVH